jgi:hypothetical protein
VVNVKALSEYDKVFLYNYAIESSYGSEFDRILVLSRFFQVSMKRAQIFARANYASNCRAEYKYIHNRPLRNKIKSA